MILVRARRAAAAFLVVLVAMVATGCGAIDAVLETEKALEREGFRNPSVSWYSENGVESVTVSWRANAETEEALVDESLRVAEVIWRVAPVHFDTVMTDPSVVFATDAFATARVFPRQELEAEFGPRPAGLDQDAADLFNVRGILIGVAVAMALGGVLTIVIIVLLVRSSRRKRAAALAGWGAPPGWPPPPPPGSWPPLPHDPWQSPPT